MYVFLQSWLFSKCTAIRLVTNTDIRVQQGEGEGGEGGTNYVYASRHSSCVFANSPIGSFHFIWLRTNDGSVHPPPSPMPDPRWELRNFVKHFRLAIRLLNFCETSGIFIFRCPCNSFWIYTYGKFTIWYLLHDKLYWFSGNLQIFLESTTYFRQEIYFFWEFPFSIHFWKRAVRILG